MDILFSMNPPLADHIAQCIKFFRHAKGLTQEELANKSALDRTYISGVERGVRNITLNSLERIIAALDIEKSMFFKRLIESFSNDTDFNLGN